MRAYELVLVLRPSLKEDERKKLLTGVLGFFEGSNVKKQEEWGQKSLAYSIKHETSGYYVRVLLETEGQIPVDFEKRLYTNDSVLRHLFLRNEKKGPKMEDKPSNKDEGLKIKDKKEEKTIKAKAPVKKEVKLKTKAKTVKKKK